MTIKKTKKIAKKLLSAKDHFVLGKHGIGFVNDTFLNHFGDTTFEKSEKPPVFQKLPRDMNDAAIESELKPGFCELGDVLAFLENPPEGTKDGYANLFYTPSFVVFVLWLRFYGHWGVSAWRRHVSDWDTDTRVFSPANFVPSKPLTPEHSDSLALPDTLVINGVKYKKV